MPFSEKVQEERYQFAQGRCECSRVGCAKGHLGRCTEQLLPSGGPNQEVRRLLGAVDWDAHHVVPEHDGGEDNLQNCQVLCVPCHRDTPSYGQPG